MGAVVRELSRAARRAGATIRTGSAVTGLVPQPDGGATVVLADGSRLTAVTVLVNCAPAVLRRLLGEPADPPSGSPLKINLLLRRLPRLRSGLDPETAFASTLHLDQGSARLQQAYEHAASGRVPCPLPSEAYCHTLTDPSVLSLDWRRPGTTLTLFGLHTRRAVPDRPRTPPRRGATGSDGGPAVHAGRTDRDCLAADANGDPCVEVMTPVDLEAELGCPAPHLPRGPGLSVARRGDGLDPSGALGCGHRAPRDPVLRFRCRTGWRGQRDRWAQRGDGGVGGRPPLTPAEPISACAQGLLVFLLARR